VTKSQRAPADRPGHALLAIEPGELRDTIRISFDRELIDQLDRRPGSLSRSECLEQILDAPLQRDHPHLPDDWTPENAANRRYERLFFDTTRPAGKPSALPSTGT
jgi:hypothetical protein